VRPRMQHFLTFNRKHFSAHAHECACARKGCAG